MYGHPVLTFPAGHLSQIHMHYSVAHLIVLAHHYMQIMTLSVTKQPCFAFLADFRAVGTAKEAMHMIVQALDRLQVKKSKVYTERQFPPGGILMRKR